MAKGTAVIIWSIRDYLEHFVTRPCDLLATPPCDFGIVLSSCLCSDGCNRTRSSEHPVRSRGYLDLWDSELLFRSTMVKGKAQSSKGHKKTSATCIKQPNQPSGTATAKGKAKLVSCNGCGIIIAEDANPPGT